MRVEQWNDKLKDKAGNSKLELIDHSLLKVKVSNIM